MDPDFALIAVERRPLADLVAGLTPEQLATPSLCAGWTVQDVVGHLAGTLTGSLTEFFVAMARSGFSFARANTRMTKAQGARPVAELVATLREHVDSHFVPPGMDWTAPLTDTMVHREDITVPLGLPSERPVASWLVALDFLVSPRARRGFVRGLLSGRPSGRDGRGLVARHRPRGAWAGGGPRPRRHRASGRPRRPVRTRARGAASVGNSLGNVRGLPYR